MGEVGSEGQIPGEKPVESRLAVQLVGCLEQDENLEKKTAIVREVVGPNFSEEVRAEMWGVKWGKKIPDNEEGQILKDTLQRNVRGLIFEKLAEKEFCQSSLVANELLVLMSKPQRFGMEEVVGFGRNPDVVFIEVDEESAKVQIVGFGEIKSGMTKHLSFRKQMFGTRKHIEDLVMILNGMTNEELAGYGLVALAKVREIKVSEDCQGTLIVTGEKDLEEIRRMAEEWRQKQEVLPPEIEVAASMFKAEELEEMGKIVSNAIRQEMRWYVSRLKRQRAGTIKP